MNPPLPGLSNADGSRIYPPEITQPASVLKAGSGRPVDSPYTSARSPSGHLVPYSPAPARRYSQAHLPWITGSQTSFREEPGPPNYDTPQAVGESVFRTSSSHTPFNANNLDPLRRTPCSIKSISQHSISEKSYISGHSIGRASYREHRGTPARARTPATDRGALSRDSPSPGPLERTELGGSTPPGTIIMLPDTVDPNRLGEPTVVGPRFVPMPVSGVLRYDGHRSIRSSSEQDYKIEAMAYQYPEAPVVPEGWEACRHPEGARYFVHGESRTFTEVDIWDEDIREDIEYFRTFLFSELKAEVKKRNLTESLKVDQVQLVLEPKRDELGVVCCYYFVNPQTRCLFWLDEWEGEEIFKECKGALSPPHKGLAIQAQYWCAANHWDLYPNFCEVTQELKNEVVNMILHATCDHLTSNTSSCPLSPEELKNHLALVDRIDPEKTGKRGHCAIVIGRIMYIFYHTHFLNYYGEDCARLNFDQTVHGWRYHPSLLMTILAPLLFMTPVTNVRLLHRIYVDEIASKEKWNIFVTKLNSQLQETSVLATVLLNANVSFLPKQSGTGASPQEYLSYMSLVASVASIILGLVFMGDSRTEERSTPFQAVKFLHSLRHEKHGLETLAIVYSLPHAFLMWGMFLFFAAFAVQWCYPGNTTSRACVGAFMLVVALSVAWCIWTTRDRSDLWWFQSDPDPAGHGAERGSGEAYFGTRLLGISQAEF